MCQLLTYKVAGETNPNNSRIIGKSKKIGETSQLELKNGAPGGSKPFQKQFLLFREEKNNIFFLYLQKLFYYHHYHQKKQNEITIIFTEKITECTYR